MARALAPIALPPGVARQATPRAQRGRFWDANWVRWLGGVLQPIGGWAATDGLVVPETPRAMLAWRDNVGLPRIAIGTRNGLYIYDGSLINITPDGFTTQAPPGLNDGWGIADHGEDLHGTPRSGGTGPPLRVDPGDWWSLDNWGQDLLALATSDGRLLRWSPGTPKAVPVANAPLGARTMIATEERHIILAGRADDFRRISWCDQEDPTSWVASATNLAGGLTLKTAGEPMVMKKVREGVLLLTDDDAHLIRYLGPPDGYGLDRVGSGCGPIGPHAIVASVDLCAWQGPRGFWLWQGGVKVLPCPMQHAVARHLNQRTRSNAFGALFDAHQEIWFFYPSEASEECDRYLIANLQNGGVWSWGRMARTAATIGGSRSRSPLLADAAGLIHEHETGTLDNGKSRVGNIWAETAELDTPAGRQIVVRGILPDVQGDMAAVAFRFFARDDINGREREIGPVSFPRGTAPAAPFLEKRFAARYLRLRIEAASDDPWALGEVRLDATAGAGR